MKEIAIIEAGSLGEDLRAELNAPPADEKLPHGIQTPAVIIRRHERSTSPGDSYGFPKATYIDGYDEMGNLVTTEGLCERSSAPGRLWQKAVEEWKVGRVLSALERA